MIYYYQELIKKQNYKSRNIIFLTYNNSKKYEYKNMLDLECSEEIKIFTYENFIKSEINKYWSIIIRECDFIKVKNLKPVFVEEKFVEYVLNEEVSKKREQESYFLDLTSSNINITKNILTNIKKASESLIDFKNIKNIVLNFKQSNNNLVFEQMNKIIDFYLKTFLENGVLDGSLSIFLYNKVLLKNEFYVKKLETKDYLIIDDLSKIKLCEVDFIKKFKSLGKKVVCYFDKTKDYFYFNNVDIDYTKNNLLYEVEVYKKFENDNDLTFEDINSLGREITLNEESLFYNEMIKNVCEKIKFLIKNNVKSSDIAVITPLNDNIFENLIKENLGNIEFVNLKTTNKLLDDKYIMCLYVFICFYYDFEEVLNQEEILNFIVVIFNTNKINATKILKNKEHIELINQIKSLQKQNLEISEALEKFYFEKIFKNNFKAENIKSFQKMFFEIKTLSENLKTIYKENFDKSHLTNYIKEVLKDFKVKKQEDYLIISSPITYLNQNINKKYLFIVDISNELYNIKIDKEISNLLAFRKTYKNKVYDLSMEEYYKDYYTKNLIYSLFESCEKVFLFKSEYSINALNYESDFYYSLLNLVEMEKNNDKI